MTSYFRKVDEYYHTAADEHSAEPQRSYFVLSVRYPSPNPKKYDHIHLSQTFGAEAWADMAEKMPPKERDELRGEARSIITWLETFLFRSDPLA